MEHHQLLRQLIRGEAEIRRGEGHDLDAVMSEAARLIHTDPPRGTVSPPARHPPAHPGEILREEFLHPLGKAPATLEVELDLPARQIIALCEERIDVDPSMALCLARALGTTASFWLNLQRHYETGANR